MAIDLLMRAQTLFFVQVAPATEDELEEQVITVKIAMERQLLDLLHEYGLQVLSPPLIREKEIMVDSKDSIDKLRQS